MEFKAPEMHMTERLHQFFATPPDVFATGLLLYRLAGHQVNRSPTYRHGHGHGGPRPQPLEPTSTGSHHGTF